MTLTLMATLLTGSFMAAGSADANRDLSVSHEIREADGHRSVLADRPAKPIGARLPIAVRNELGFMPRPLVSLKAMDHTELILLGEIEQQDGAPLRYGVTRPLSVSAEDGMWVNVPGGRLWQIEVQSIDAENLHIHIENMNLPEGAELRTYAPGAPEAVAGPFTDDGPMDNGDLWSLIQPVDSVIVEYFQPDTVRSNDLPFELTEVLHGYLPIMKDGLAGGSGSCHNEATCYDDWEDVGDATALVSFGGGFVCSGQLIATSAQDETAYYMTANHCISTNSVASSAQFIFRYERVNCTGGVSGGTSSFGSTLIDTHSNSDSTLLRLTGSVPSTAFWVGWTTNTATTNLDITCVHHPAGDRMKISFGDINSNPVCGSSSGWFGVRWNDGVTEGGSSGSGAYRSSDQKLMGVLTCGASSCSNQNGLDGYGRFATAFNSGGFDEFLDIGQPDDDPYDDNDTCSTAAFLTSAGDYNDLVVKSTDEDWYRLNVPGGQTIQFDLDFSHSNGDVDIALYAISCSGDLVSLGNSNTNDESVSWSNYDTSVSSRRVFARVFMDSGTQNDYDMTVSFSPNPEPQGSCCVGTICSSATEATCLAAGGTWGGADTACDAGTCAEPVGACCIGDGCFQLLSDICASAGGTFNGVGTDCASDTCASDCVADTNNDGTVNGTDLATVLGGWGLAGGDLNGDGTTNGEDLAIVLAFWGDC
ncbi:MAG: hypothetical protein CMJ33_03790 [Phycisphaerae bacterium]|nr:hypothetical protein [Phycisphaerae bacterium]